MFELIIKIICYIIYIIFFFCVLQREASTIRTWLKLIDTSFHSWKTFNYIFNWVNFKRIIFNDSVNKYLIRTIIYCWIDTSINILNGEIFLDDCIAQLSRQFSVQDRYQGWSHDTQIGSKSKKNKNKNHKR